jgi:hypothetical protein
MTELETAFAVDYYPHVILSSKGKIKQLPRVTFNKRVI